MVKGEPAGSQAVRELAERLREPQPLRRGSLGERYLRCGKPNCACARDEKARHGPYFSLTRVVGGRTQSRRLSVEQAARARQQLAAGQEFRRWVEAYWQAGERWADAELGDGEVAAQAEKGGSVKRSRRRSSPKSRR